MVAVDKTARESATLANYLGREECDSRASMLDQHLAAMALLSFFCAAGNPRVTRFELDGGCALVTLSNGVEFEAVVEFGQQTSFCLAGAEGEAWLKRNKHVLVRLVDAAVRS